MRQVTKDQFFKVIGPLDVHPRVDGSTLRDPKIVSYFEHRHTRHLVGVLKGSGDDAEYFLTGGENG